MIERKAASFEFKIQLANVKNYEVLLARSRMVYMVCSKIVIVFCSEGYFTNKLDVELKFHAEYSIKEKRREFVKNKALSFQFYTFCCISQFNKLEKTKDTFKIYQQIFTCRARIQKTIPFFEISKKRWDAFDIAILN